MAISVDSVYKKVLTILNKESRGFMGPDEFMKLGSQVQLDLLERNFHDYNRAVTKRSGGAIGQGYANIPKKIQERIDPFYVSTDITLDNASLGLLPNFYYILSVSSCDRLTDIEKIDQSKISFLMSSPLTSPSTTFPIYYLSGTREGFLDGVNTLTVAPNSLANSSVKVDYIKVPINPVWAHVQTDNFGGVAFYGGDPLLATSFVFPRLDQTGDFAFQSRFIDFELHPSQEVDLVLGILRYAGIIIRDPSITQPVQQETQLKTQLEN